jgi:formylglycine-generating enzyme required for sulfatase activity
MQYGTATIQQFLNTRFSNEQVTSVCYDYFPEVYLANVAGISKQDKIQHLVAHCQKHDRISSLLAMMERERPYEYKAQFSSVPEAKVANSQLLARRNPHQLFVSHSYEDADLANYFATDLQRRGWPIWIARKSIRPGEKWLEAVNRGLDESGILLLVLTPDAVKSDWVHSETSLAMEQYAMGQMQLILVEMKPTADVPTSWVDHRRLPFNRGYKQGVLKLLSVLELVAGPPPKPVEAPVPKAAPQVVEVTEARPVAPRPAEPLAPEAIVPAAGAPKPAAEEPASLEKTPPPGAAAGKGETMVWEKDGKEMVLVPAGPFLYGEAREEESLPEYWVDKTPVSNAEYARFVAASGNEPPSHWGGDVPPAGIAHHPVVFVSWDDAAAYAAWTGKRLPTEEEWEKAARGEDGRQFPWGDDAPTSEHCNFDNNVGATTPVKRYSPQGDSYYGCSDMAGNVWEWTDSTTVEVLQVFRGGAFNRGMEEMRAANRDGFLPDERKSDLGFRTVVCLS